MAMCRPPITSDHPDWVIENWDNPNERVSKTFKCIMRALTNCKNPTRERMFEAWRADYANYVDEPMPSVEHRPKTRHWQASKAAFRPWINKHLPARILVCGYVAYNQLPCDPELGARNTTATILARISWTNLPPHLASAL